jgi:hypothetical protein
MLAVTILLPLSLLAQIYPKEGAELNYRIVGFRFAPKPSANSYTLEVASGTQTSDAGFDKSIIKSLKTTTSKLVVELPSFGAAYTWRIVYKHAGGRTQTSPLHHFTVGSIPETDTNRFRLSVTTAARTYKDGFVFLDGNKVLYNMKGEPVWYLPQVEGRVLAPRDLKLTTYGTITLLEGVNYDGHVLWKAPNNGRVNGMDREYYHHEFTRLSNGHYMVLGNEMLHCSMNGDSTFVIDFNDKLSNPRSFFATLIEYDNDGAPLWVWRSSKYFSTSDLVHYKSPQHSVMVDLHENSFYFDEAEHSIYLSTKYLNRIVKIKYPEGTVTATYGRIFTDGSTDLNNEKYCAQHSVRKAKDGGILLFNNNVCLPGKYPTVEKLVKMPKDGGLKKVWEYTCSSDVSNPSEFPSGGNVLELPDSSIFVSTAAPDSRVFIVNTNKEIQWSATAEMWNDGMQKWQPAGQYRASFVASENELEKLIWNSGTKEQPAAKPTPQQKHVQ